jgi:hypothetical protein
VKSKRRTNQWNKCHWRTTSLTIKRDQKWQSLKTNVFNLVLPDSPSKLIQSWTTFIWEHWSIDIWTNKSEPYSPDTIAKILAIDYRVSHLFSTPKNYSSHQTNQFLSLSLEVSLLLEQLSAILTVTVQKLWYKRMPQNFLQYIRICHNTLSHHHCQTDSDCMPSLAIGGIAIAVLCQGTLDLPIQSLMNSTLTWGF